MKSKIVRVNGEQYRIVPLDSQYHIVIRKGDEHVCLCGDVDTLKDVLKYLQNGDPWSKWVQDTPASYGHRDFKWPRGWEPKKAEVTP